MAVQKLKIFLWADGLIILLAVIFFVVMYLRRGNKNQFRDDLWEKRKPLDPKQRAAEDQIDQKILLEHRPEPGDAEPEAPKPQPESQPKPAPRRAEFQLPNFRGKPHEVLGVPATLDQALPPRPCNAPRPKLCGPSPTPRRAIEYRPPSLNSGHSAAQKVAEFPRRKKIHRAFLDKK